MKHKFLLTFIGLAVAFSVMAQSNRTNPDVAKYYIKGNLSIEKGADGKTVYKLSQIDNSGIYFEDPHATRIGEETSMEDVLFQFSRASTDYPGGINTPLDFWRYDNTINEWQPDVETRQGTAGVETKKSMVVMLVLDCSSSLGTDFNLVQGAANNFIRSLYEASQGSGNIKLGVVCFSKINETKIFNIRPLTASTIHNLTDSLNSFKTQNGTALYYAMDKAIDQMEEYCRSAIPSTEPLSTVIMVTFTDGLDQTSRDPDKDILTADNYYDKILAKYGTKMQNKNFNGIPLQHEIRGVKGNDIISEAQLGKFQRIGESLGNFKRLNNYSELGKEFEDIAKNLIDQWRILNLYVPNSFSGRVAWTYPGERVKPTPPKPPVEKPDYLRLPLLGLNVGVGGGFSRPTKFLDFSVGLDFAAAIKPKFAMGTFLSYKTTFQTIHQISFGLDFMIGPQRKAFLLGLGCNHMFYRYTSFSDWYYGTRYNVFRDAYEWDFDLRIGGVFKAFYFFTDFSIGGYAFDDSLYLINDYVGRDWSTYLLPQISLNVGINFMQIGKK